MDLDREEAAPLPPRRRQQRQLNSPSDIEHIQSLLHGAPGDLGSVPSGVPAATASNAGGDVAGRRRHARPRPRPPPRPPPPRPRSEPHPASASSAPPDTSRFAVPGPRSTARALHCHACDCFVPVPASSSLSSSSPLPSPHSSSSPSPPPLPASWISHVAGIRHSRAALGAAMSGGVPGSATVVSIFEERQQQQQRGQRRRAAPDGGNGNGGGDGNGGGNGGGGEPYPFSWLRTECLKELLRHSGVTDAGRELAERFSPRNIGEAFAQLLPALDRWAREAQQAQGQAEEQAQAGGGVGGPSQQERGEQGARRPPLRLESASPAMVAVLAFALDTGLRGGLPGGGGGEAGGGGCPVAPPPLELSVQLKAVHERDLPAMTAACALLARSLRRNARLRELTLDGGQLPRGGSPAARAQQQQQQQRLWGLVAGELARSLRSNDALESLTLALPRRDLRGEDARELRAAASGAKEARRRAFLSAAHPRCYSRRGRDASPLSSLPMDLMVAIAAMGIGRSPCRVEVEGV